MASETKPKPTRDPEGSAITLMILLACGALGFGLWIASSRYHFTPSQIVEACLILCIVGWMVYDITHYFTKVRPDKMKEWPPVRPQIGSALLAAQVEAAVNSDAVLLGHETNQAPVYWTDADRAMQTIVSGMSGSGKTTLIESILQQDIRRGVPIIFFDGKGENKFLDKVLPVVEAEGRMADFRLVDPSQPECSVAFNPFWAPHGDPDEHVAFVFESFRVDAGDDFFDQHQKTYLTNIARILHYSGKRYTFYDILVAAYDKDLLHSLIKAADERIRASSDVSRQQRLTFEMSVKNLLETFEDKDRVSKIQGLLNNLSTFLSDDLSLITGQYDNLLTVEDVLEKNLILYVNLNINVNANATVALGRLLLQNLQLALGRLYANTRWGTNHRFVSVLMDEFAPFAYANFGHILQTARGANVGFLFALQTYGQLAPVGFGLRDSLTSGPNNSFMLRMRDENTTSQFMEESGKVKADRISVSVEKAGILGGGKYEEQGRGSKSEVYETTVSDQMLKALPTGDMQILMTDHLKGQIHRHVHIRKAADHFIKGDGNNLYPAMLSLMSESEGLNLRFRSNALDMEGANKPKKRVQKRRS